MVEKVIKNVLELSGVDGACILDKRGTLLHNSLPPYFIADFLEDLSRRILSMYEAVDENYLPCDDYLLKFPQKFIQIRRSRTILLIVIVDPGVNLVSLRMVTNIVLKHVTPKIVGELRAGVQQEAETRASPETPAPAPIEAVKPAPVPPTLPEPPPLPKIPPKEAELEPVATEASPAPAMPPPKKRFYRGVEY
ncbi:MAG: hypothetical protein JJT96_04330 [Opitutales bacterium]|nr:hypothetical protein [Opitutales bacterium]